MRPAVEETTTVAIIGDVGGWADQLVGQLRHVGADPDTGHVPPGLHIIQVGDLVHKGPASDQTVDLVASFVDGPTRQRWTQLAGNHEAHYLGRRWYQDRPRLSPPQRDLLRRWRDHGLLRAACVVDSVTHGPLLVTHAGVTSWYWQRHLGSPNTAGEAAERLNHWLHWGDDRVFLSGILRGHTQPGPLWASATDELYPSWATSPHPPPFGQVHGHTAAVQWRPDRALPRRWTGSDHAEPLRVDLEGRHTVVRIGGCPFIAVDPSFDSTPPPAHAATPWLDAGTVHTPGP